MTDPLRLAVFGDPVAHSLSPFIHRAFAEALGLAVDYRAIHCPAGELDERLAAFARAGGRGANLTVPLKTLGLEHCASLDPAARRAGAVNTLIRRQGAWHGDNTDGAGLVTDLRRLGVDPGSKRLLLLGAGGAAAGVLYPLLATGPARVHIANRSVGRAVALADEFSGDGPVSGGGLDDVHRRGPFDVLIQATSLGHDHRRPPLELAWLAEGAAIYDLNYGRAHEPVAAWCRDHGIAAYDGLGMLVGQAAHSFERWTRRRPDPQPVLAALRGSVGAP